jgi:Ca2+-binding RTX toxin-like protein
MRTGKNSDAGRHAMNPSRLKHTLVALASVAAMAIFAAPAGAATATISSSNHVVVTGQSSDRDQIGVSFDTGTNTYLVFDAAGVDATGVCTNVTANLATCPGAAVVAITIKSGNGSDVIILDQATIPATIEANLDGGSGNDIVRGSSADDSIGGGSGDDQLDGRPGADDLRGGSNTDTLLYADRTTPVSLDVGSSTEDDGNELDQSGNSRDTVRSDIERVAGGSAGDVIVGDSSSETLFGGPGPDTLIGNRGNDSLSGSSGDDVLFGQDGNDAARGEDGNDRIGGGGGNDKLVGGLNDDRITGDGGSDRLLGKAGIDRLFAKDGQHDARINCGSGPNGAERGKRDKRIDPKARRC